MTLSAPPPFPRIPHLPGSAATSDDSLVSDAVAWLRTPVVVEEKLDGANVAIWRACHGFAVAGRGGIDAQDRAGQLGRLRAWTQMHHESLDALLGVDEVLYGEWLWLEHSLRYDRLPDWFVALDLWTPERGFITSDRRDARVQAVGLVAPPRIQATAIRSVDELDRLCGPSAWSSERMEGLVLRQECNGRLVDRAKWVRPDFLRKSNEAWRRPYPTNALFPGGK